MKLGRSVILIGLLMSPSLVYAGGGEAAFGLLRTARTFDKSVWNLGGGGIVSLEDGGREAVTISFETGLNAKSDIAGRFSISGDDTAFGGLVNYLIKPASTDFPLDLSVQGGLHYITHDENDAFIVAVTVIGSKEIKPKLSLYGGFDLGFGNVNVPDGFDGSYTTVSLIPGLSYQLKEKVSVAAEFGIGLNDNASNYIAGLVRYSIKR